MIISRFAARVAKPLMPSFMPGSSQVVRLFFPSYRNITTGQGLLGHIRKKDILRKIFHFYRKSKKGQIVKVAAADEEVVQTPPEPDKPHALDPYLGVWDEVENVNLEEFFKRLEAPERAISYLATSKTWVAYSRSYDEWTCTFGHLDNECTRTYIFTFGKWLVVDYLYGLPWQVYVTCDGKTLKENCKDCTTRPSLYMEVVTEWKDDKMYKTLTTKDVKATQVFKRT